MAISIAHYSEENTKLLLYLFHNIQLEWHCIA